MSNFNTRMGHHVLEERKKEAAGISSFTPLRSGWLSKIKQPIYLTIVKLEDHVLILAGCKSKLSLTSATPGFLPRI